MDPLPDLQPGKEEYAMARQDWQIEAARDHERWRLWLCWILASSVGEGVGFGLSGIIGASGLWATDHITSKLSVLIIVTSMVLVGAVGGSVVRLAPWLVVGRSLQKLPWSYWVLTMASGTVGVWVLGLASASSGLSVWPAIAP
jgi:hypothetical protein